MVVLAVGDDTMIGQIALRLGNQEGEASAEDRIQKKLNISKESTPLQQKLTSLAGLISKIGYTASIAIFIALLGRGLYTSDIRFGPKFVIDAQTHEYLRDDQGHYISNPALGELESTSDALRSSVGNLLGYFVYMVIIVVVAVPEGLPMSVTVSLALAMRKMTRANSLVRQLVACETIGSATVICTDKTGTLTQNKMQVARVGIGGSIYEGSWESGVRGQESGVSKTKGTLLTPDSCLLSPGLTNSPLAQIILNAAVNSSAHLEIKAGSIIPVGNSTEGALLLWLRGGAWVQKIDGDVPAEFDYSSLRRQYPARYRINFSSERKRMTTVIHYHGRTMALVKGAPEVLLERSTYYLNSDGEAKPWTPEAKENIRSQLRDAAGMSMRTLGFAHAEVPASISLEQEALHQYREELESNLIFEGFVAIRDPLARRCGKQSMVAGKRALQ